MCYFDLLKIKKTKIFTICIHIQGRSEVGGGEGGEIPIFVFIFDINQ